MSKGWEIYQELLADLRSECDEMVANGEYTQEMADFRYDMRKDEILESLPDELFSNEDSEDVTTIKWNLAEDGHCCLCGAECIHDGCWSCPVEQCYSYPASYSEDI